MYFNLSGFHFRRRQITLCWQSKGPHSRTWLAVSLADTPPPIHTPTIMEIPREI